VPPGPPTPNPDSVLTPVRVHLPPPRAWAPLLVGRTVPGRYGLALLVIVVTILGKEVLGPLVHPNAVLAFLPAVWFSARQGGLGPGLVSSALAAVVGVWLFMPLGGAAGVIAPVDVGRVAFFVSSATLVSWITARHRTAVIHWNVALAAARDELEARVASRTADLATVNAQLRQSEALFRSLADASPAGIAIVQDDRFCYVNAAAERNTGYPRDELLGKSWDEVVGPGQEAAVWEWGPGEANGAHGPIRTVVRITTRDGQPRWHDLMATVITYRGAPATLTTAYDITDRVRAEQALRSARDQLESTVAVRTAELLEANRQLQAEVRTRTNTEAALRESEARWRGVVEHLPAVTYIVTPDTERRPLYISPQVVRYLGFTPEESMADPSLWERTIHPQDHDRVTGAVNRSRLTGEPISLEHRMVAPDGTVTWFAHEVIKIRDAAGAVQWFEGIMLDITARKQAEYDLIDLNRRTFETLENMLEGCFVLDGAGTTVYVNPSAARLLRKSREELIGRDVFEVFPDAVETVFYEGFQRVRADRVARHVEGYSPPINRWLRAHMSSSGDGFAVLFEDVTDRHEREVGVMSDVLNALNRHADPATAWRDVAAALERLTGCGLSALCLFDEAHEWGRCAAHSASPAAPPAEMRFRLAESRAAADILAGRPFVERDVDGRPGDGAGRWWSALGMHSRLSLPLRGRADVLGMLLLAWQEPQGVVPNVLPLLRQIADAVALAVERHDLFAQVQAGRARLEALSQRLLEVQESERRHLARELHDEIGQALTGLRLQLDAAGHQAPAVVNATVRKSYDDVSSLLERVRSMALDLRPAMLDDLGLLPTLLWLLDRYEADTGIRVRFEHRDIMSRRFPSEVETAAFRIVQEGLTNVARHAAVQEVTVRAWAGATTLGVQIVDTGVGFDAQADASAHGRTVGLSGMRERALLLGGDLVVESAPGRGTCISAEFPLETPVSEEAAWASA